MVGETIMQNKSQKSKLTGKCSCNCIKGTPQNQANDKSLTRISHNQKLIKKK